MFQLHDRSLEADVSVFRKSVPANIEQDDVSMKVLCRDVKMVKVKPVENEKIQFNIANQMYPSACDTCLVSHFVCSEDVIKVKKRRL